MNGLKSSLGFGSSKKLTSPDGQSGGHTSLEAPGKTDTNIKSTSPPSKTDGSANLLDNPITRNPGYTLLGLGALGGAGLGLTYWAGKGNDGDGSFSNLTPQDHLSGVPNGADINNQEYVPANLAAGTPPDRFHTDWEKTFLLASGGKILPEMLGSAAAAAAGSLVDPTGMLGGLN